MVLVAGRHPAVDKAPFIVEGLVGLGHHVVVLFVGSEIDDLVGHLTVDDAPIRGFDEPVLVDPGIGAQRADEANVGTFRGLNGTHSPIVGVVHVPDFKACPLPTQSPGTQGAQPSLVGQLRQRVGLIHELGKLA